MKHNQYFEIILTPQDIHDILTAHFKSIDGVDVDDVIYIIEDDPTQPDLPFPNQVIKEIILKGKLKKSNFP